MNNKKLESNISLVFAKIVNGLNTNALKFLLPVWILPLSAVTLKCVFACVVFWIISFFRQKERINRKDKFYLFFLGMFCIYIYFFFYQLGISKTTPISASIFISLQPIWVFLIAIFFYKEKLSLMKIIGIIIGLVGALLCILSQHNENTAGDLLKGNIFCLISSIGYAFYLTFEKSFIRRGIPIMSILKYTFSGAAVSSIIVTMFHGFGGHMFDSAFNWKPYAILSFVLIFPTVIGYILIPIGLKNLSTTVVSIYGYLTLVVVAVVSLIIGQDHFNWTQLISMLLICLSIYFVEISERSS